MRLAKNPREQLIDTLLSLVLLNYCAAQDGTIGDRRKVSCLIFLATHELFTKQIRALNFSFYHDYHCPFTVELHVTWGELLLMGFLDIQPGATGKIVLTSAGVEAAKHYKSRLAKLGNQWLLESFQRVADTYCQLDTSALLTLVYKMDVRPIGWQRSIPLSNVPMNSRFTCILESDEAMRTVALDEPILKDFFAELPSI